MLRIHFETDDLLRVRVAAGPDPLWETLLSLHMLLAPKQAPLVFGEWRARTRETLPAALRFLLDLTPPRGYSPDFLTPSAGAEGLEPAIDAVLSTPKSRLRRELELLGSRRRTGAWTRSLADGEPQALHSLGAALRLYHRRVLTPDWHHLQARVEADRAVRARAFLDGGIDEVLGGLHPAIRWEPPVLHIAYATERDAFLRGRGLVLLPR
jgi:hypothetical protein